MKIQIEKHQNDLGFLVKKADYQAVINHLEGKGFSVWGLPPELSEFGTVHFKNSHPEKIEEAMKDFVSSEDQT